MTRDEFKINDCHKMPLFQLECHNLSDLGDFKLTDNVSELNDCIMCGPMNRKGFLCEDCVDEFALNFSFTSMGHKIYSNCTDAWFHVWDTTLPADRTHSVLPHPLHGLELNSFMCMHADGK